LQGDVPWVTGADRADDLIVGAVLPDGLQALFVLPARSPGVRIDPPMQLTALVGSRTSGVHCEGVELGPEALLAGPAPQVLGPVGGGGLETSCLALGLAGAAVDHLRAEAERRPELHDLAGTFETARVALRERLHGLAREGGQPAATLALRVDCTQLALRSSQAALAVSRGSGFVVPHPAQRWARQALFFLVWSCPRPAAEGILADLMPDCPAS
jgi:alkylation response protein AidB-like acyl-CoA dehydrogenase